MNALSFWWRWLLVFSKSKGKDFSRSIKRSIIILLLLKNGFTQLFLVHLWDIVPCVLLESFHRCRSHTCTLGPGTAGQSKLLLTPKVWDFSGLCKQRLLEQVLVIPPDILVISGLSPHLFGLRQASLC